MKTFLLMLLISTSAMAIPRLGEYPLGPQTDITPGRLCSRPDSYRYPEHIAYCKRDVDSSLKRDVFQEYRNLGYNLDPSRRGDYKIDHLIPLCAGGSNEEANLWPQHKTVYAQTDALEGLGCQKLSEGKIKQSELIKMILDAKHDLSLVSKTLQYFESL